MTSARCIRAPVCVSCRSTSARGKKARGIIRNGKFPLIAPKHTARGGLPHVCSYVQAVQRKRKNISSNASAGDNAAVYESSVTVINGEINPAESPAGEN